MEQIYTAGTYVPIRKGRSVRGIIQKTEVITG
jgi:hypothetical protein